MNLKQFADHLGLSVTTVSRAFNGHALVKAETRQRVLAEAARLHYHPSSAARSLATGKSGSFGLFLEIGANAIREPLFREFLIGLIEELSKSESDLIIKPTATSDLRDYDRLYQQGRVDGFVLTKPKIGDERVAYLQQKGVPFVVHGPAEPGARHSFVTIDNGAAIASLTSLLADLGHRRVAFLNHYLSFVFAKERLDSFKRVVRDRGLEVPETYIFAVRMDERSGYQCTTALLAEATPPTAIICGSMLLAQGAYRAIAEAGLTVGRDISVVAHDDVNADLPAERFRPQLTCTDASLMATGERVGAFLVRLAAGEPPHLLQEIIPPKLIYRASAHPPLGS